MKRHFQAYQNNLNALITAINCSLFENYTSTFKAATSENITVFYYTKLTRKY